MGTKNSKHESEEAEMEFDKYGKPVEKYKPSVYGWGQLVHPVKSNQNLIAKKKQKKWQDPTVAMTPRSSDLTINSIKPTDKPGTNQRNSPLKFSVLLPKTSQSQGPEAANNTTKFVIGLPKMATRNEIDSKSTPDIPTLRLGSSTTNGKRLEHLLKRKSVPSSTFSNETPAATVSQGRGFFKKRTSNLSSTEIAAVAATSSDLTAPIKTTVTSTKTVGSYFYGQYRCVKCKRYWRSGLSKDGVTQSCSKCNTPTFPRR